MTDLFKQYAERMVVAIDPGETTGVALVRATEYSVTIQYTCNIPFLLERPEYFRADLLDVLEQVTDNSEQGSAVVVVEKFVAVGGAPGIDLTPLVVMGAVSMLMADESDLRLDGVGTPVRYQIPAEMRTFYKNKTLVRQMRHGLSPCRTRRTDHEMDAVAHALTWLTKRGHKPTAQLMAGEPA